MSNILKGLQLNELSPQTLASYKKKAGADATAADKAGNYERGNKRFSGIVKATKKEFDNDAKKVGEGNYHANRTGFSRGQRDDERHDLDVQQSTPQVWGLKINGKVWSKDGKYVTFKTKEAALNIRNSILKNRPDLEIGLVTKGGVAEGRYDSDDYYNPRMSRDYGARNLHTDSGAYEFEKNVPAGEPGGPRGAPKSLKGISKALPADAFGRTTGKIPKGKPGTVHSMMRDIDEDELDENCWKGYHKEGNKELFGKTVPNCVKNEDVAEDRENYNGVNILLQKDDDELFVKASAGSRELGHVLFVIDGDYLIPQDLEVEEKYRGQGIAQTMYDYVKSKGYKIRRSGQQTDAGAGFWDKHRPEQNVWEGSCPHCGGEMVSEELMNEKKDACYYKVKSRYKVWPSAYASGALVKCRKKGADSWGNGGKKNESSILEGIERADENLHQWFKEKWVRFGPDGKIRGDCARGDDSEGKPKCLPQSKAQSLGKKGRASAASRKRREDPNPERSGKAINVNTKKKSNEGVAEGKEDKIEQLKQDYATAVHWSKNEKSPQKREAARQKAETIKAHLEKQYKQGVAEGSGGNWYIRINGKILNDTKFKPEIFSSEDEARSHAMKLADKKRIPLSQIKLTKSWMDAPEQGVAEGQLDEKWSKKYKDSINCSNPKGFSQKAHCAGKKK